MIIILATKTKTDFGRSHVAVSIFVFLDCSLEKKKTYLFHNDNGSPPEGGDDIVGDILVITILVERVLVTE